MKKRTIIMMMNMLIIGVVCAFANSAVTEESGCIVLMQNGEERYITNAGIDRSPTFSSCGRYIAFIRGETFSPEAMDYDAIGYGEAYSDALMIYDIELSNEKVLYDASTTKEVLQATPENDTTPENISHIIDGSLHFSPDAQRLYFLGNAWVTSYALHEIDIATGERRYIVPATELNGIVSKGKFKDHLVVRDHRYFLTGGSYDWLWLITPEGSVVGAFGENENNIDWELLESRDD